MYSPITAKCDDCGAETDRNDLYDSPWKDSIVRCAECFLISEGYTRESLDAAINRIINIAQRYLANANHSRQFNIQKRSGGGRRDREMSVRMTALDEIIEMCTGWIRTTKESQELACAELAQLRAAADELQRIRELIEPLNGQSVYDAIDALLSDASSAEIYKIDMAEQARQLDEVREIITSCASLDRYVSDGGIEDARVWLAANPAPESQP